MKKKLLLSLLAFCIAGFSLSSTVQAAFRTQMIEGNGCTQTAATYATRYPDTYASLTFECPLVSDSFFWLGDARSITMFYNTSRNMTVSMKPCRLDTANYAWLGAACGTPASFTGKSGSQVYAVTTAGFSDLPGGRGWQADTFYVEVTVSCDGKSTCTGFQLTTVTVSN